MSRLDRHIYKTSEVVIGGCLATFLFAYYTGKKVAFVEAQPPFLFDEVAGNAIPGIEPNFGHTFPAVQVWEYLLFALGMNGQIIGSDLNRSIRVDDGMLKITTEYSRMTRVEFEKLWVFDPRQVKGLPPARKIKKNLNRVIDWVNVKQGSNHTHTFHQNEDKFMNKVWWYNSPRFDNSNLKDCVVESYLTDEQVRDFDYSETIVRMALEELYKDKEITKYPRLDHAERVIIEDIDYVFDAQENVEHVKPDADYIIDQWKSEEVSPYVKFFPSSRYSSGRITADRV